MREPRLLVGENTGPYPPQVVARLTQRHTKFQYTAVERFDGVVI